MISCPFYSITMITDKLKELEALRSKTAALEAAVAEERNSALATLPQQYGFESADAFVEAVLSASGTGGRRRGRPLRAAAASTGAGGKKRRRRAKITKETHAQVKKLVEAGKTGAEIAKIVGISLPSVQNVKKALGLVQSRK